MLKLREMNPGYIYRTWALVKHEGEEKPAVYIHTMVPSLPKCQQSSNHHFTGMSIAPRLTAPLSNTLGPHCALQIHWNFIWVHGACDCQSFAHPLKGLEDFGDAKSLLHILCLLPSLHSAAVRKVVVDGPEEMGVERLLLTEAQLALSIAALPSPFLHLPQIRVSNSYLPISKRKIQSQAWISSAGLKTANCCLCCFVAFFKKSFIWFLKVNIYFH